MDSNIISPTSRTRLVVASQALEIQHLQDLLRATERDLSDTSAKLVSEKQELERRLAQEQAKSRRLDEQVRLLGEKLRSTEQQMAAATAGGVAGGGGGGGGGGNNHPNHMSSPLLRSQSLTGSGLRPSSSRSPNLLDSVMNLGGGGGGDNTSAAAVGGSGGAGVSSSVGGEVHDGHAAMSSPQQQHIALMKRVAEMQATNSSLIEERDLLRGALEEVQLQLQRRGRSPAASDEVHSIIAATLQNQHYQHVAGQRGGSAGLLDAVPTMCSQSAQTSDPTDSALAGIEQLSVEDIRNRIVNEQLLQKYFQQLGIVHAANAQQLAGAMHNKIEAEMARLHQQHEEYRKMLHSVPVVLPPSSSSSSAQFADGADHHHHHPAHHIPVVSPFNAAGSAMPAAARDYQNPHVNMTPRVAGVTPVIPAPPPHPSHVGIASPGTSAYGAQQQQQQQQQQGGFIKQQQHEMSVLKRRLDELQERHKSLQSGNYAQQQLLRGNAVSSSNDHHQHPLASTTMGASLAQPYHMPSQLTQDDGATATGVAASMTGPVPRTLFPVSHQQQPSASYSSAPAATLSGGVPAAVGAAQAKMDRRQQAAAAAAGATAPAATNAAAGVMARMYNKATSLF